MGTARLAAARLGRPTALRPSLHIQFCLQLSAWGEICLYTGPIHGYEILLQSERSENQMPMGIEEQIWLSMTECKNRVLSVFSLPSPLVLQGFQKTLRMHFFCDVVTRYSKLHLHFSRSLRRYGHCIRSNICTSGNLDISALHSLFLRLAFTAWFTSLSSS